MVAADATRRSQLEPVLAGADVVHHLVHIEGLRNETIARDERIRALDPFELTSFDDAARAALAGDVRK